MILPCGLKWQHDFALRVVHNFDNTNSAEIEIDDPTPPHTNRVYWAGPLSSDASGNPIPSAKKHWIRRGETVITQIDGQVLDFSRPGSDIRYVPKRAVLTGAADGNGFGEQIFLNLEAPRQQVDGFTMDEPGGIEYEWQIQYGVRVNVDDLGRVALPKIFSVDSLNSLTVVGNLEGTFWFDPGVHILVASAANETTSKALGGWFNGDSYYFSGNGAIDSVTGDLLQGGPITVGGSPVAVWEPDRDFDVDPSLAVVDLRKFRGLEIQQLRRPARVLWSYDLQVISVTVPIGKYVFQGNAQYSNQFKTEPSSIQRISVSGANPNPGPDMAVWDAEASRLFPVVPGRFEAFWSPGLGANGVQLGDARVIVIVEYPTPAHYPHIADTPFVALDPDPSDDRIFKEIKYTENQAAINPDNEFTASTLGKTVLLFGELQTGGRGPPREFLSVRVVDTREWDDDQVFSPGGQAIIGTKITDPALDLAELGTGFVMFDGARYNGNVYDAEKLDGLAAEDVYDMVAFNTTAGLKIVDRPENLPGPIIPVNLFPGAMPEEELVVVWYDDPLENEGLMRPHASSLYEPRWPNASEGLGGIVIASQFGSESFDQEVVPTIGNAPAETTYNPARLQQVQIYNQRDPNGTGYNPNEEHALIAPSLRFAEVSPRPPAIYALRENDLNFFNRNSPDEENQPSNYTSHPFVLVQFFDTADSEFKMRVYSVVREDPRTAGFSFANQLRVTPGGSGVVSTSPTTLLTEPHVTMEAGEPVIPFYPLGPVIGAVPCAETFGQNIKGQETYWEDHKGSNWAISGGENAWLTTAFHYPLQPDFWWPDGGPGAISGPVGGEFGVLVGTGDCVAFLPDDVRSLIGLGPNNPVLPTVLTENEPIRILYKSEWPRIAPVLKAGETLTFPGGEFRADHPTMLVAGDDGEIETVETPGLPGVLAFASAEVVFDSLNPSANSEQWKTSWTARVAQVLDQRKAELLIGSFPSELSPATGRTRVSQGQYVFNELPASLQKRFRYDPIFEQLVLKGLVNDKGIEEPTLTAAPPAVFVLEPNIMVQSDLAVLQSLDNTAGSDWDIALSALFQLTSNPDNIEDSNGVIQNQYLVGLEREIVRDPNTEMPVMEPIPGTELLRIQRSNTRAAPFRGFGPGLPVIPNGNFLDPTSTIGSTGDPFPEISWITVVENNDPSLGGSPITPHVIKVDRGERYRGAIKTILSDNVFDENMTLRHTGDFGANAQDLFFEWWYRVDDGSLNVPPPDLVPASQTNPWKLFPDTSGAGGRGNFEILLMGNPNAPEVLLADTFWFVRYRHLNDAVDGTDWNVPQPDLEDSVNFTWAGAGNSDPFNDFDFDGFPDFRAQLAFGWIKRVLDAVNPYEARIRDFENDNPSTRSSLIAQLGPRFEGPVALNPAKNVIENVGLIELYETVLKRGRDLSIDLSRPVSTPAIANALQLASTRISDFYVLLGHEAYTDAVDPTIGFGSNSVEYGSLAPAVHTFQNQMSSVLEEELGLLRGVDDFFARPVYNRLFWNFIKGEGEAAYALNYNISDVNKDGFIDEDDAMILYPQGHGDARGHYLTALRNQYELLNHRFFNWVSRSEFYNLQDIVIKVDFLDERKFAQAAADLAKADSEIVDLTYRDKYLEDPTAQWQGYTDSNKDRSWGVQGWARRAGQGAYFNWVMANVLLPSEHPNETLEGIQKVDRGTNSDIAVISANLNRVQHTFDEANKGKNPLGLARGVVPFDIDPERVVRGRSKTATHFEQIYERAVEAVANAVAVWDNANQTRNLLRKIANSEAEFRNKTFQEDLTFRNRLIKIFGRPYEGTIGPGNLYPAGYNGPDLALFMYVKVREINQNTVPGPTSSFAQFGDDNDGNTLTAGEIFRAFDQGEGGTSISTIGNDQRQFFSPTFALDEDSDGDEIDNSAPFQVRDGWYDVRYTDLVNPKVPLDDFTQLMPVTAAGYTFQAPNVWGQRLATGELQTLISKMIQQEAQIASAIGNWDALTGEIGRQFRLVNSQNRTGTIIRNRNEALLIAKGVFRAITLGLEVGALINDAVKTTTEVIIEAAAGTVPTNLPTGGFSVSPGDALGPLRGGLKVGETVSKSVHDTIDIVLRGAKIAEEAASAIGDFVVTLENNATASAQGKRERLKSLEDLVGDEPVLRVRIFREIEILREMSDRYVTLLNEGNRLLDERIAFNKRVAAQTQRNRYQDMTFRVSRNHALENYHGALEIAARYAYLAAKAYQYETNFDSTDPGAADRILTDIIRARGLGHFSGGQPRLGKGGISEALARLKINYDALQG